jgi:ribonuclease Z
MRILILGSGSATPTVTRNPTAQILEVSGRFFLIDCGETTQLSLLRKKIPLLKINHIFISHLHGDHWLGLPGLISSMHLGGRTAPLKLFCPKGMEVLLQTIFQYSDTQLQFEIEYHFHHPSEKNLIWEDDGMEIFSFPLTHKIPCNGFLFQEKPKLRNLRREAIEVYKIPVESMMEIKSGKDWKHPDGRIIPNALLTKDPKTSSSYAFCSDTAFNLDLPKFFPQVTVLYHEATFTEELADRAVKTLHSTALQAGKIAQLSNAKNLLIGHFSSRYKDLNPFLVEVKRNFENTTLVFDGFIFDF